MAQIMSLTPTPADFQEACDKGQAARLQVLIKEMESSTDWVISLTFKIDCLQRAATHQHHQTVLVLLNWIGSSAFFEQVQQFNLGNYERQQIKYQLTQLVAFDQSNEFYFKLKERQLIDQALEQEIFITSCQANRLEQVKFLLDNGFSPNSGRHRYLETICVDNQLTLLNLLFGHGLRVDDLNDYLTQQLWLAVGDHLDVLHKLLAQGLKPPNEYISLFNQACRQGHLELIKILWSFEHQLHNQVHLLINWAFQSHQYQVLDFLLELEPAKISTICARKFVLASRNKNLALAQYFIDRGQLTAKQVRQYNDSNDSDFFEQLMVQDEVLTKSAYKR